MSNSGKPQKKAWCDKNPASEFFRIMRSQQNILDGMFMEATEVTSLGAPKDLNIIGSAAKQNSQADTSSQAAISFVPGEAEKSRSSTGSTLSAAATTWDPLSSAYSSPVQQRSLHPSDADMESAPTGSYTDREMVEVYRSLFEVYRSLFDLADTQTNNLKRILTKDEFALLYEGWSGEQWHGSWETGVAPPGSIAGTRAGPQCASNDVADTGKVEDELEEEG